MAQKWPSIKLSSFRLYNKIEYLDPANISENFRIHTASDYLISGLYPILTQSMGHYPLIHLQPIGRSSLKYRRALVTGLCEILPDISEHVSVREESPWEPDYEIRNPGPNPSPGCPFVTSCLDLEGRGNLPHRSKGHSLQDVGSTLGIHSALSGLVLLLM